MSFTIDFVVGEVKEVLINGAAIALEATYKVSTNSFMDVGGDMSPTTEGCITIIE